MANNCTGYYKDPCALFWSSFVGHYALKRVLSSSLPTIYMKVQEYLNWFYSTITSAAWDVGDMQLSHGIYMVVTLYIFRKWTVTSDFDGKFILLCVSKVRKLPRVKIRLMPNWFCTGLNTPRTIFSYFGVSIFPWSPLTGARKADFR